MTAPARPIARRRRRRARVLISGPGPVSQTFAVLAEPPVADAVAGSGLTAAVTGTSSALGLAVGTESTVTPLLGSTGTPPPGSTLTLPPGSTGTAPHGSPEPARATGPESGPWAK